MIVHQNIKKGCVTPIVLVVSAKTNVEILFMPFIYIVYDSETKRINLKEHYDLSRFAADDSLND